jgi:PTS system mannose-specific IIA component
MKGIILVSHGKMAEGMADTCRFIMGEGIEQLEALGLKQGESPEEFGVRLQEAAARADTGDGVIILCDLFGGTPCNQAMLLMSDTVDVIAGMNFPLVLELLTARMAGSPAIDSLIENGRQSLQNMRYALQEPGEGDE